MRWIYEKHDPKSRERKNTCTRIKKNEETIEWNLPSQVVKASPGVRVQCLGFRVRIFKGPSVRGFLAQTGLKVHVSGGFKRPSRWPCVGWKRTQMARPTPPSLPPTCLAARAGLDMKMDFPSPSLAPSTCLSVSFHPSPSPPSLLPSSFTPPQRTRRTNRFPHPARVNNVSWCGREKLARSTYVPKSLCSLDPCIFSRGFRSCWRSYR